MKIIDCFPFFNELDLLEIRLHELSPVVDRFVLAESVRTHQGKSKPLYYKENIRRFSAFTGKITHVIVDQFPENPENKSWIYERHQRQMLREGLDGCDPDDLIMVSDLDEIPRAEKIAEYKHKGGIQVFQQDMYYYFMNCINSTETAKGYNWYGSAMARFKDYRSPQYLRDISIMVLNHKNAPFYGKVLNVLQRIGRPGMLRGDISIVEDGGWHFSYLGGVEKIIQKIESFAHSEYNREEFKDPKYLKEAIEKGKDIYGRGYKYSFVPLDDSFPSYVLKNKEKFSGLIR